MLRFPTLLVRPAFALAAAGATFALAAPVLAAPVDKAPTALVRLDAADISAATTTIHDRIAAAARKVCTADSATLHDQMMARQCVAKAVRSGEVQLVAQREQAKARQQTLVVAAR